MRENEIQENKKHLLWKAFTENVARFIFYLIFAVAKSLENNS